MHLSRPFSRVLLAIVPLCLLVAWARTAAADGPTARAICIGLDRVDPRFYDNDDGQLSGPTNDASDMADIARANGFGDAIMLLNENASYESVLKQLDQASKDLRSGRDILLITYSGHGGTTRDPLATDPNDRRTDQTWCLFDGQMADDTLYSEFSKFAAGTRILVFSDSCHSGTITKMFGSDFTDVLNSARTTALGQFTSDKRIKSLPPQILIQTYKQHYAFYDRQSKDALRPQAIVASVLSTSACADDQAALAAPTKADRNSVFTDALKRIWNGGAFQGNYDSFYTAIREQALKRNPGQTAQKVMIDEPNQPFESQRPFTVAFPSKK
jgi:hypothetical protein